MPAKLEVQENETPQAEEPALPAANVAIKVESLIIGRSLVHPIYDTQGLLLLAAGAIMTPQVRQRLKDRRIDQVFVSPDDAASVTLADDLFEDHRATFSFDTEMTQKLDELI